MADGHGQGGRGELGAHGADGVEKEQTRVRWTSTDGRIGPTRRGRTDGQTSRRGADGRTGRSGPLEHGRLVGQMGGRGGGPGFKRHHSSTPFHSWAPSPLASSERKCVGCLGVRWGPGGFPLKYLYLAPGLTCLV